MVVASSGWIQNANFAPNQCDINLNTNSAESNKMNAKGILLCRDNSHVFQDRTLNLDQPVKIGRSVARTRAAADNAIFDCKVLSRNHALLSYNAGKFYLQDTRSSNGTFVNNQRLSATGSESAAKEVCSGDIVQFGVDVVESTKKVTHGCIVATLKLYLPDGKEAKASRTMYMTSAAGDVTLEDLYKLNQVVQEASRREKVLHSKLAYLEKLVEHTRKAADQSWKALIDEDRLLTRVKTVESQLVVYSKNYSEDKIRNELIKLEEDKSQYQIAAKEALEKVHQEKLQVTQKLVQLEGRLNETEDECESLHEISKHTQNELQELAIKYTNSQKNLAELEEKLAEQEQNCPEFDKWALQEKQVLEKEIKQQSRIGRILQRRLNENRLDSVQIHKKITGLKNYMQTLQDINSKFLSEESIDGVSPIEALNAILVILNEMMADEEEDDYRNVSDTEDELSKSQESQDSNQKIISNYHRSVSLDKKQIDSSNYTRMWLYSNDADNYSDHYILPPQNTRQTLVNGKTDDNDDHTERDTNAEASDDTCSLISDDATSSLINNEEQCEKSIIEINPTIDTANTEPIVMAVKLVDSVNEQQSEVYNHPDNRFYNDSNSSINTVVLLNEPNQPTTKDSNDEQQLNNSEKLELDTEKLEPDNDKDYNNEVDGQAEYIKTLKPIITKNIDCNPSCTQTREYILQMLMTSLESLTGDDNLESQQLVKRELDELRGWLINEPNDIVVDKLKEFYYRAKNDNSRMYEVTEELVILKEKYNSCNDEKTRLCRQYSMLKAQCGDLLNTSYSVPIQYVAPVVIALVWMLFEKIF